MLKISMVSALMAAATGSAAYAQTIVLEPEDEIIVREYVLTQPRRHVVIPEGYEVVIGERLPDTIVVEPLDPVGFEQELEYVFIGDRAVLVDPQTREIVTVLD